MPYLSKKYLSKKYLSKQYLSKQYLSKQYLAAKFIRHATGLLHTNTILALLLAAYLILVWTSDFNLQYSYALDINKKLSIIPKPPSLQCKLQSISSGDTMSDIFLDSGASWDDLYAVLRHDDNKQLFTEIYANQKLEFCFEFYLIF